MHLHPAGFDPSRVKKLARRCERAKAADAKLDREIWLAAVATPHERALVMAGAELHGERESNFRIDWMADGARYTASLDAAMALVPEGCSFRLYSHADENHADVFRLGEVSDNGVTLDRIATEMGEAEMGATPALALCAAALRARAAQGTEAQRAETATKIGGSVHDGPVPEGNAP
jgi:hypothetical protein